MKIDNTDFNIEQCRKMSKSEFTKLCAGILTKTDVNTACKMLGVGKDVKPKKVVKSKNED